MPSTTARSEITRRNGAAHEGISVVNAQSLTQQEAARLAGCSKDTIARARRAGRLPHARLIHGRWMIPADDLVAAGLFPNEVRERTHESQPERREGLVDIDLARAQARIAGAGGSRGPPRRRAALLAPAGSRLPGEKGELMGRPLTRAASVPPGPVVGQHPRGQRRSPRRREEVASSPKTTPGPGWPKQSLALNAGRPVPRPQRFRTHRPPSPTPVASPGLSRPSSSPTSPR